ncbi:MAG: hypothetical protein ACK5N0_10055 [Synechococcaceae cyanobacterium]
MLLWLIRWLMANSAIRPQVALMRHGPPREEFEAVCPTNSFIRRTAEPWTRRLRRRFDPFPSWCGAMPAATARTASGRFGWVAPRDPSPMPTPTGICGCWGSGSRPSCGAAALRELDALMLLSREDADAVIAW